GAAGRPVRLLLEHQARNLRRGPEREVAPAVTGGPKKRLGRVPAPAVLLVHLEVAHALVAAAIEVAGGRYAGLLRRLGEGIEHVPAQALLLDAPFAATAGRQREIGGLGAMELIGAAVV